MLDVRARTSELRAVGSFLRGLGPFLACGTPPLPTLRAIVASHLADRERTFALVLDRAVFGNPRSPYRRLIAAAGLTKGDIDAMLAADGLETTLEQLHGAGVYVTLEEFKGRLPVRRHGLELAVGPADFDNPMTVPQYAAETGGSGGAPRPIQVNLDLLECEAAYHALFYAALGAAGRPVGIWHLSPPGAIGLKAGLIGLACASSPHRDDVHLLGGKVATIERPRQIDRGNTTVAALFHTTVSPSSPKILLNVESGDLGVRASRTCDCGALPGYSDHLHTIRNYEKLTSEGMHLLGVDLLALVEEVLPERFGGHPTDYQFLEREEDGLTRVSLLVRPTVRPVDADQVVGAVLQFLRDRGTGQHLMADVWAQGHTLRVVRDHPLATPGGKIPPLRTLAG